ncbi:urease accessory protein [Candidatus Spongiihabitans sp.]|uniref:urease accessory protein n=1 Tax=Candidatus Spongiihabitans sp. TaxID=3101308 RepID=UPI003C7B016C
MEPSVLYSILTLGFGLGLLHALDADHIMAVSALASGAHQDSRQNSSGWSIRRMMGFCCTWALGHGAVLFALAALLIFAKIELPAMVAHVAEKLIGVLLIGLGAWIFWNIRQHKLSLEAHSHDAITHVHLSTGKTHHTHQSVLVGATHGLAGSAPVLALIPALETTNTWTGSWIGPWIGLGYVALFSLGALSAMLVFGLFFGQLQKCIAGFGQKLFQFSRMAVASVSIAFGCYWLFA